MGRRGRINVEGGSSATDIMTALIGCLILILLGILVIVLVSQALIIITDPDQSQIVSVTESNVDGFRESKAFPHGNRDKEPTYVDVYQNRVELYRLSNDPVVVSQRELTRPGNEFDRVLNILHENSANEYVIFLIRPNGVTLGRRLKKQVMERGGIDVGTELFNSDRPVDHVSATAQLRKEELKRQMEKMQSEGAAPEGEPSGVTEPPTVPITPDN